MIRFFLVSLILTMGVYAHAVACECFRAPCNCPVADADGYTLKNCTDAEEHRATYHSKETCVLTNFYCDEVANNDVSDVARIKVPKAACFPVGDRCPTSARCGNNKDIDQSEVDKIKPRAQTGDETCADAAAAPAKGHPQFAADRASSPNAEKRR
jgi:hypothetical protein